MIGTKIRSSTDPDELANEIEEYRYLRKEEALRKAQEAGNATPKPGGCNYFIVRKQRYCSNMASVSNSDGMCISHSTFQYVTTSEYPRSPIQDDDTDLAKVSVKGKRKRNMNRCPKHMLNPFKCPESVVAPNWQEIYSDPTLPLLLDIGCAKGRWIEQLASGKVVLLEYNGRPFNYCGVELYAPLVEMANANILAARREDGELAMNLHYVAANINTSLRSLAFPALHTVCIQFPDPWIKKRKRRVVTPALVAALAAALPTGGQVRH
jgi:tRNA (guanine-N7-)-methyltransferase